MARVRYLKPIMLTDEDVVTMSIMARYVWTYLPCFADCEGRLEDKPVSLKLSILPNDSVDMNDLLQEITDRGFITRYTVANKKYIQINNFLKHQKRWQNEPISKIPGIGYTPTSPTQNNVENISGSSQDHLGRPLDLRSYSLDLKSSTSKKDEELPSSLGLNSFESLFGEWPPYDNPNYNESKTKAEAAFNENINAENYEAFVAAWNLQLNLYKKDKSKDKRRFLGSFRTFCEGRWMNVKDKAEFMPDKSIEEKRLAVNWE